jgi:hypothetical protein
VNVLKDHTSSIISPDDETKEVENFKYSGHKTVTDEMLEKKLWKEQNMHESFTMQ